MTPVLYYQGIMSSKILKLSIAASITKKNIDVVHIWATLVNIQTFYCDVSRLKNVFLSFIRRWSCCWAELDTANTSISNITSAGHPLSSLYISSSSLTISSTLSVSPFISYLTGLLMFLFHKQQKISHWDQGMKLRDLIHLKSCNDSFSFLDL